MNKTNFFNDLSTHILEPIYLTDKTDEVNKEIKFNHWGLNIPSDIISQTTTADFLAFIQKVKDNYKNQLDNSGLDIDLIFYLWFDEMAGELRFNFINSNHHTLPFGCKLKYTDLPETIIDLYLQSNYHEGIPWDEFTTLETSEREKELHDHFVLMVYQEKIKKERQNGFR